MKTNWIFILLALVSCTQQAGKTQEHQNAAVESFRISQPKKGIVHKQIHCLPDTAFSYALYLPDDYNPKQKPMPVIFFFDAHKRGALPVVMYAELAEKYGFILAGSNNSVNGQQADEMKQAVSLMIHDVNERFHIDTSRMTAAGFSGGARVAADIALFQQQQIIGVIGCAAGFPQMNSGFNTNFSYLGMVGDKDFNYPEMKNLDKALDQTSVPHYLLVYEGKHDWPPQDVMSEGFVFLLFDAMKRKTVAPDDSLIETFLLRNDSIRAKAAKESDLEKLAETNRKVLAFLQNIVPLDKYSAELDSLKRSDAYKKLFDEQTKLLEYETKAQQRYASAIHRESLKWWLNEVDGLYQKPGDPVDRRLLSYLSLVSYMYASGTLRNNQLKAAQKYLTIYEKVDPENPEVYYLKAVLLMRTHQPDKALSELRKAVDNGFKEYGRMKNSRDFSALSSNEEFEEILSQLRGITVDH